MSEHIHFVTGRLAERALRSVLEALEPHLDFETSVGVMPITVAALMTPQWIADRLQVPATATKVMVPGYCSGDLAVIEAAARVPVVRGPRDLRELPQFLGQKTSRQSDYGAFDIQILAEINHAPRLTLTEILEAARLLADAGADIIDVGCEPGGAWSGVRACVRALRDAGHRVSIDSLNPVEIAAAAEAGAELVLSVNASNREAAVDWGCEVVAIPDEITTLGGLDETVDFLATHKVPLRIDPIIEPIGCGFGASLGRYLATRQRYPDAEMLMGIGNLTELTDADSAAINVLLLGLCQELGIRSVLTTQVINWARTSVRECDLARRLVHYAVGHGIPPKHLEPQLIVLRDERLHEFGDVELERLSQQIKDHNYRLFAERGQLHLLSAGLHLHDGDPFQLFEQLLARQPQNLDAAHSFYLGFEMAKAHLALTLGKQYEQDESLDWGFLTVAEQHHRLSKKKP